MTNTGIKKCISLLDLNKIVVKNGSKYFRTTNKYNYNNFKVQEILETRYKELELMGEYSNTKDCYMKFLANELDDNTLKSCGKCCNCIKKEYFSSLVKEEDALKAENFIKDFKDKAEYILLPLKSK